MLNKVAQSPEVSPISRLYGEGLLEEAEGGVIVPTVMGNYRHVVEGGTFAGFVANFPAYGEGLLEKAEGTVIVPTGIVDLRDIVEGGHLHRICRQFPGLWRGIAGGSRGQCHSPHGHGQLISQMLLRVVTFAGFVADFPAYGEGLLEKAEGGVMVPTGFVDLPRYC